MLKQLLLTSLFVGSTCIIAGNEPSSGHDSHHDNDYSAQDYNDNLNDIRSYEQHVKNDPHYYDQAEQDRLDRQEQNINEFQAERDAQKEEAHQQTVEAHKDDNK